MRPEHVLLIFVDGLGVPHGTARGDLDATPLAAAPSLCRLIRRHGRSIDACLNVSGLPQSATGQTALLTGVNAPSLLGEHRQGFPGRDLRRIIAGFNLFVRLAARGCSSTFANAYVRFRGSDVPVPLRSVTTVAALSAFGDTRGVDDLIAGRAVYHDLTRETLRAQGRTDIPAISEQEAARHLLDIARAYRFTLFEYFLTDIAGHRGDLDVQQSVLRSLDRFLAEVVRGLRRRRELFLLTSDHGNIEEPGARRHTHNPVPFVAVGCGARRVREPVRSIVDVTPAVVALLTE